MGVIEHDRLVRLLGGQELSWLMARVRRRMERGQSLETSVTLPDATAEQRAAVQRLLGRAPRSSQALTVSLPALDHLLRDTGVCTDGLAAAVVALGGEIVDRQALSAHETELWHKAFEPLAAAVKDVPRLEQWLSEIRQSGLVRRLSNGPEDALPLLRDLATVVRAFPVTGEPLGLFAARLVGRAHALDDGEPLSTLALGAARAFSSVEPGSGAEWRREVWASVGVLRDEVSSTVLTLALPGDVTTPTGRALAALYEAAQPAVLTLRQLVNDGIRLSARRVFVCENPVVVSAAAAELGPACAPLICASGQPAAAAMHLLRQLAGQGVEIRYHGDFDWGGLRIGNVVFDRLPAKPWRFGADDYLAVTNPVGHRGRSLIGTPVTANWDPALGPAMASLGLAVEEEQVLSQLLIDLRR